MGTKRLQQHCDAFVKEVKKVRRRICERVKKQEGRAINCFPMTVSLETAEERENAPKIMRRRKENMSTGC